MATTDITKDKDFDDFERLYYRLKEKYGEDALSRLNEELRFPVSIFTPELSSLELVVKYLRENLSLSNKTIATLLNRSEKTVWQAYSHAQKKMPKRFSAAKSPYTIPLSVLSDRTFSVLESIAVYLKNTYSLSLSEIASLLHRDQRTIWTVCHRYEQKRKI